MLACVELLQLALVMCPPLLTRSPQPAVAAAAAALSIIHIGAGVVCRACAASCSLVYGTPNRSKCRRPADRRRDAIGRHCGCRRQGDSEREAAAGARSVTHRRPAGENVASPRSPVGRSVGRLLVCNWRAVAARAHDGSTRLPHLYSFTFVCSVQTISELRNALTDIFQQPSLPWTGKRWQLITTSLLITVDVA